MAFFARSLMTVLVSLACLGCGPGRPTGSPRIHRVSLSELVRAYRTSGSERRYDGLTIQVHVPSGGWVRHDDRVEAHRIFEHRPYCVHLRCDARRLDPSSGLVVTGVCRGVVRDGEARGSGIDWYLVVDECRVTELPDD